MKIKSYSIAFALLVCTLLNTAALAGVKSKEVTFAEDVTVGDTLVKQGSYKVAFDEQAKELQVMRGGKIIARTAAHLEEAKTVGKFKPAYRTLKVDKSAALLLLVDVGGMHAVVTSDKIAAARAASTGGQ